MLEPCRRAESLRNGLGVLSVSWLPASGPWVLVRTCPCDDVVRHLHAGGAPAISAISAICYCNCPGGLVAFKIHRCPSQLIFLGAKLQIESNLEDLPLWQSTSPRVKICGSCSCGI